MTPPSTAAAPRPWLPIVVAAYVALAVLFVYVVEAQRGLFQIVEALPDLSPHEEVPTVLFALMIGFGVCVQVGIVATIVLVSLVRWNRIFERRSLLWLDVLWIAVTLCALLTGGILINRAQSGQGGIVVILLLLGLALLALAFVLLVLRSLLRRAILLRSELDEVV
jgi:hypothetical protein